MSNIVFGKYIPLTEKEYKEYNIDLSKIKNIGMSSRYKASSSMWFPSKRTKRIEKINRIINNIYKKNEFDKYGI